LNLIRVIPAEAAVIPEIHLTNVSLSFRNQPVFCGINLHIPAGKCVALLGASGVGKTSLLRILAGLSTRDEDITGTIHTSNDIPIHQQIAYMAQQDLLMPWLTTFENATLSLTLSPHSQQTKMRKIALAHDLLEQAGLGEAKEFYPHQLSGGMRQRTALVRTLVQEKPIVLLDEPFSTLDTITRYHLQNLALTMLRGKTIVFITHDPAEALRLADKIYLLEGSPANIHLLSEPSTSTPRIMHEIDNINMHTEIFTRLTAGSAS
jgi:putative hydroxymethylpyrimidine transport system ATP-binding protein